MTNEVTSRDRAQFFQAIGLWKDSETIFVDKWLDNFNEDELDIAYALLGFFQFYSEKVINKLLEDSMTKCGWILKKRFNGWNHENFKNRCFYSIVPGDKPNITDSGHIFARKVRLNWGIPEDRFIDFDKLPQLLKHNKPIPLILLDDILASGAQIYNAWNLKRIPTTDGGDVSLAEIVGKSSHCVIYAPLIIIEKGYLFINESCRNLNLVAPHILGNEYNLFHESCICWNNDLDFFKKGTSLLYRKAKQYSIPNKFGQLKDDIKGFNELGLAIAFEHGTPDSCSAIFHWDKKGWKPLIKKNN